MATKNKVEAYKRIYKLTDEQVKSLKSVFGDGWTKFSKKAIDAVLETLGKA
jgi:hypothetical protein